MSGPHRAYIVNMDFIRRLTARELLLTDGKRIPISQSRYGEIKNSYFTYMTHV
ncbi:MAG: LytTR family transcriptional regulator DNA-binding domain-containing protein [Mediterraneibacter faecis]